MGGQAAHCFALPASGEKARTRNKPATPMLAAHTTGASKAAGSFMKRLYMRFASVPATTAWRKDNQFTAPEGATADDWEPSDPAITRAHRAEACGGARC